MDTLESLGLSKYESKALLVTLRESVTLKELSRRSGIPFGKVYSVVRGLVEKGLVQETDERPKRIVVPDPSQAVASLIERKQSEIDGILAQARQIATEASVMRLRPQRFFEIGTTQDENREIQSRSFVEAKREVCQILNVHHRPKSNRGNKLVWERAIAAAVDRGVRFRCIYPSDAVLPPLLQRLPAASFAVRRLDTDFVRCDIIDARKALVKLVHQDAHQYGGVLFMENERLARNLQSIFEQLWAQAV